MGWSVMLFAAGFGNRMKHLTADRPKPMVEVAGRPLIDHARALTDALPADTVVANLHYKAEILQAHLHNTNVQTIAETPDILETGGGLRNALHLLGPGPVMTLNTDAIWQGPNPLDQLQKAWDPDRMDGLLMCIPPQNAVGYDGPGNFLIGPSGQIKRGDGDIYSGAQIVKTERLAEIDRASFSLNILWDMLMAENRLYAVEYEGLWCDVGHPQGVTNAERLLGYGHV
ncbi:nucleotidyltransferase family protein [Roseobacter litoralis]|uniref:nucleotidyltransferase family protein n=1 Tax=Roseobacter litoralis TaxID=42443 RepID=UPI002494398F|nr:nucleotidyltransferase family protein [Roseobacter litoralis]